MLPFRSGLVMRRREVDSETCFAWAQARRAQRTGGHGLIGRVIQPDRTVAARGMLRADRPANTSGLSRRTKRFDNAPVGAELVRTRGHFHHTAHLGEHSCATATTTSWISRGAN